MKQLKDMTDEELREYFDATAVCPHCNDSVANLYDHLKWCEPRMIRIARRVLGLLK